MAAHHAHWPRPLPPGGTIGICSPAGPSPAESLDRAVAALEARGYRVRVAPHAAATHPDFPYLAGTDDERAGDLNALLRDPTVDLILCARGGYGCARILDRVDYDAARTNPKPVVGYSDITALSLALLTRSNVVSFSGLMATAGHAFGEDSLDSWSEARFFDAVTHSHHTPHSPRTPLTLPSPDDAPPWTILRGPEEVTGQVVPVCLSLLYALSGTSYVSEVRDLRDAILVVEDVGEELYAVDRMLTQLRLSGVLEHLKALLFGSFNGLEGEKADLLARELPRLAADLTPPHVAVAMGVAYGHIARRLTLPVGATATVNLRAGTFTFF